ncbi:triose-phosphate transporter [Ophiostoma piceae UAMH 11346]|uniref:Triose-phosphate transporter n=1 Tax=Ophiostoma piceae (strain UAMH 11346) TaxID=1262450 RepID=S3D085_OPHP1|nr:triose-phosphate transporter [Ophiostoma piceae UAMH 11346]
MPSSHQLLPQNDPDDIERQVENKAASTPQATIVEDTISTRSKLTQLGFYFLCNVALTIYNKLILGKFPHPWLLTALHTGSASVGCYILRMRGAIPRTQLDWNDEIKLVALSVLFTVNIAISNVSLAMVSVPFHQIVRSTTPVVTVAAYRLLFGRSYSNETYLSLIPIVFGVGMTTYGEYYFTIVGFLLTFLGVILAAAKTIATNRIMTGSLKMSPLETLMRMSPLSFFQALFIAWVSGELSGAVGGAARGITNVSTVARDVAVQAATGGQGGQAGGQETSLLSLALALLGNGVLAFALNVTSFTANKAAGALTMTVCGNVKQCLTVLLGIVFFNVTVGFTNGLGMVVSLAGAAWYSVVELRAKAAPPPPK